MMNEPNELKTYVPKTITLECPGCSAVVGAEVKGHYKFIEDGPAVAARYLFACCPSCGAPMVALQENWGDWNDDRYFDKPTRILPARSRVSHDVPDTVSSAFDEASRCFYARAYTASAIMCRKAVEALVKEHGIKSGKLVTNLKSMRDQGLIDAWLFEWADSLRLAGNDAAHDPTLVFSQDDAKDILDFAGALIEYVFTFRARFEKFKKRRSAAKPESNETSEASPA